MSTVALEQKSAGPARAARPPGRDVWAVADQALISGTNFVTMILVAKGLGLPGFGAFTLVYSALLFANILQVALVTQPHNVLGTGRHGRDYAQYTSSCGLVQLLLVAAEAALALLAWGVARKAQSPAAGMLLALAPSIVFWQLQEFLRRVMYTEGRYAEAFANDVISYGGQTLVILLLWLAARLQSKGTLHTTIPWLTGASALWALAGTSGIAVIVGVWQVRHSFSRRISLSALIENWHFGKWLAGAEVLTWCSSLHMYLYLAAMLVGLRAAGALKAAQVLFGPMRVAAYYLDTVLPIRFARLLHQGGEGAMYRGLRQVLARIAGPLAAYCLLVALFAKPLLRVTFGSEYTGAATILALYSGYALLTYLQMIVAAALKAQRRTRFIFIGSVCGVAVALAVAWILIIEFKTNGVLLAMMLTALVVTALYFYASHRHMRRTESQSPREDVPEPPVEVPCPT